VTSFEQSLSDGIAYLRDACKVMSELIDRHRPPQLSPVAPERYFDVLVCSIVGQQLSVKAADTIEARLRGLVGELTPKRVLAVDDDALRAVGLSRSKIAYTKGLAEAFASGEINPVALETADDHSIRETLIALKGIGPWTAEMFMIFGLGHLDVWSPGDLGLRRAVEHYFGEYKDDIAERWQPYRSIAAWYLWEHSDGLVGRTQT
jgi:DNA-3-methyladenine glycosylase II